MKKLLIFAVSAVMALGQARADEGMWLLPMLQKLNIKDMKAKGFKLSAEDIYSVNKASLKDAIVIFGGGCTGEIVSSEGLLFTNHHCGYSSIQALSSTEHDYLKYGFWAKDRAGEIPAPGLSVRFVRHIEEVTDRVLTGVTASMSEQERAAAIAANSKAVVDAAIPANPGKTVSVEEFFGGNQYLMFVIEVYNDVRLVGTPPSSIGKFGGETDNWMWPRHTGDFSIFRVYASPDGVTPANYSAENVPYKAPTHLKVSMKGVKAGDYSMIMGFPGSTQRFMTTFEIDNMLNVENPTRIFMRGERQAVLSKFMKASDAVRIKYASKYAQSSNYWKNSIGMSRGIRKLDVRSQKQAIQDRFAKWAEGTEYAEALPLIERGVAGFSKPESVNQTIVEAIMGTEIVLSAMRLGLPMGNGSVVPQENADAFFKDYDEAADRASAEVMLRILFDSVPMAVTDDLRPFFKGGKPDMPALVAYIYDNSAFADPAKYAALAALSNGDRAVAVAKDPAVILAKRLNNLRREALAAAAAPRVDFQRGHRLLIAGLMKMDADKSFYPDANFTLRLTYGNVLPYSPADAVEYGFQTHLKGVIEKYDPANLVDFDMPARLRELYDARDFGPYADNTGDVPVAFISNNDITGGNSGSPVMNDRGELIGLAFDGNWDAMSGDVAFEPVLQRTISVDVRYVLFTIDKFAGAGYLLNEMTIVR